MGPRLLSSPWQLEPGPKLEICLAQQLSLDPPLMGHPCAKRGSQGLPQPQRKRRASGSSAAHPQVLGSSCSVRAAAAGVRVPPAVVCSGQFPCQMSLRRTGPLARSRATTLPRTHHSTRGGHGTAATPSLSSRFAVAAGLYPVHLEHNLTMLLQGEDADSRPSLADINAHLLPSTALLQPVHCARCSLLCDRAEAAGMAFGLENMRPWLLCRSLYQPQPPLASTMHQVQPIRLVGMLQC